MITKHLSLDSKYVRLAGKRLSLDDTKYFYNVNLIQPVGGTIAASPMNGRFGTVVQLSNTPDDDHVFGNYIVDDVPIVGNTFRAFNNDVSVTANFIKQRLTIDLNNTWFNVTDYIHQNSTEFNDYVIFATKPDVNSSINRGEGTYDMYIRGLANLDEPLTFRYVPFGKFDAHTATSYLYIRFLNSSGTVREHFHANLNAGQDSQKPWFHDSYYRSPSSAFPTDYGDITVREDITSSGARDPWYGNWSLIAIPARLVTSIINAAG